MYLNDFRVETILKVIDEIKLINKSDLIYRIEIDESHIGKTAILQYVSYFNRLDAYLFDPSKEPMYPNSEVGSNVAPERKFIELLKPCDVFEQLTTKVNNMSRGKQINCVKDCGNTQPSSGDDSICLNCGSSILN